MTIHDDDNKLSLIVIQYMQAMRDEVAMDGEELPYGSEADQLAELLLTAEIQDDEDLAALRLAEEHIRTTEHDTVFANQLKERIDGHLARQSPGE